MYLLKIIILSFIFDTISSIKAISRINSIMKTNLFLQLTCYNHKNNVTDIEKHRQKFFEYEKYQKNVWYFFWTMNVNYFEIKYNYLFLYIIHHFDIDWGIGLYGKLFTLLKKKWKNLKFTKVQNKNFCSTNKNYIITSFHQQWQNDFVASSI